jgi:hypothetical protein
MFKLFQSKWTPAKFWEWFAANEGRLADLITNPQALVGEFSKSIKRVDKGLAFEFGVKPNSQGRFEFIISADGIRDNMPAVEALAAAAPSLSRWTIVKYRQPSEGVTLRFGELELTPESILASIEAQGDRIGVVLFFPEAAGEGDHVKHAGFLMLDTTLGEFTMMTRVGSVDCLGVFANIPEVASLAKFPLVELRARFDRLWESMNKSSVPR